jgi:hypothetical protein
MKRYPQHVHSNILITSNKILINGEALLSDDVSLQISNIAALVVEHSPIWPLLLVVCIAVFSVLDGASVLFTGPLIVLLLFYVNLFPRYRLLIITNAAICYVIKGGGKRFLQSIKRVIEDAMHAPVETTTYNVNRRKRKIDQCVV